ncbi:hypothetical protein [Bacillus sp. N1-1]|uniref:hypothetical protein n=1 Tax=Bacillus sp. N1-1 TaxID=2682541 RepID=UPI0013169633|nr:hypothetical protein [Bacillus sp. N1-1]QHA90832.1 hypothetical protein GNK04_04960 [Bacillus sp. N1-1]
MVVATKENIIKEAARADRNIRLMAAVIVISVEEEAQAVANNKPARDELITCWFYC